jgi:hypothetical protein
MERKVAIWRERKKAISINQDNSHNVIDCMYPPPPYFQNLQVEVLMSNTSK